MIHDKFFVEWLTDVFQASLQTEFEENYLPQFIEKYPIFENFSTWDIDQFVINDILKEININSIFRGKRIYVYFLESLLNGARYASELFPNVSSIDIYKPLFDHFNPITNDLLPEYLSFLLPHDYEVSSRDYHEDTFPQDVIKGLIIQKYIPNKEKADELIQSYIPVWSDIQSLYWEDNEIDFNGTCKLNGDQYLSYLKYCVEAAYN